MFFFSFLNKHFNPLGHEHNLALRFEGIVQCAQRTMGKQVLFPPSGVKEIRENFAQTIAVLRVKRSFFSSLFALHNPTKLWKLLGYEKTLPGK